MSTVVVHYTKPSGLFSPDIQTLCIYREKSVACTLPLLPFGEGILPRSQFISLDSKIYVLGGMEDSATDRASQEVYVFNPAGTQTSWTKCASMQNRRMSFGIGTLHGKIYVFGGCNCRKFVVQCEVYDPKVDAWFSRADMVEPRAAHQVSVLGEQFYIYGGLLLSSEFDEDQFDIYRGVKYSAVEEDEGPNSDGDRSGDDVHYNKTVLGYHAGQNEWLPDPVGGEMNSFRWDMFVVNGNFHRFTGDSKLARYNLISKTWSNVHSIWALEWNDVAFADPPDNLDVGLGGHAIPLGDELLTVANLGGNTPTPGACLLQTKQFGSEDTDIALEIVAHFPGAEFGDINSTFLFPLDL